MKLRDLVGVSLGSEADQVICKHFFSGAAAYLDDGILATLSPVGLAVKLNDVSCMRELRGQGVPLRYFPNSPIKRNYVLFEDVDSLSLDRMASLFRESIEHARQSR